MCACPRRFGRSDPFWVLATSKAQTAVPTRGYSNVGLYGFVSKTYEKEGAILFGGGYGRREEGVAGVSLFRGGSFREESLSGIIFGTKSCGGFWIEGGEDACYEWESGYVHVESLFARSGEDILLGEDIFEMDMLYW